MYFVGRARTANYFGSGISAATEGGALPDWYVGLNQIFRERIAHLECGRSSIVSLPQGLTALNRTVRAQRRDAMRELVDTAHHPSRRPMAATIRPFGCFTPHVG